MVDEDIGAMTFPSSDDRDVMIPTSEDSAAAARGGGASIAERRAAKFGFNAVKISTARFRTDSPTSSPAIRSPYLTIPPGISPTALLDSPIMLHNSLALPSPTTGTFSLPFYRPENPFPGEDCQNGNAVESSIFKPYLDHKSLLGGATFVNQEIEGGNQTGVSEHQPYTGFEFPTEFPGDSSAADYCREDLLNITIVSASNNNNNTADSKPVLNARLSPDMASEQSLSMEPVHGEDATSHHNDVSYGAASRSSEDGYNWRKYGQKQVKGSEYPRSYYKCTNPNCQVKKKVERSLDGQITEIIYKGAHNHAKPLPNRRATALGYDEISEVSEGIGTCLRVEGGSAWTNIQSGSEGVEITSSASILTELSDPFSTTQGKQIESPPELSCTVASHDDDEDGAATQGSMSVGGDADGEESESKRRKKESCVVETSLTSRAVREPRVVVQIESEVDILDDGYRWRKYGQKVVKGNPNPRSYYKCTSAGCSVRKHVERASHNLKCVITTYEGKHNHEVPVARNGNHSNSGGSAATAHQPTAGNSAQPRNPTIPKPETQMQDFPHHHQFDRKPEFGNEYLRAGFPGNFGPPSIYQMKFPPLQSYAPFGRFAAQQPSPVPMSSILPDFPMPMPMPSNLPPPGMVGFDFNAASGYQHHHHEAAARFLRPKQEQRDDVVYDPRMGIGDPSTAFSSSSSAYNRGLMGGFQS